MISLTVASKMLVYISVLKLSHTRNKDKYCFSNLLRYGCVLETDCCNRVLIRSNGWSIMQAVMPDMAPPVRCVNGSRRRSIDIAEGGKRRPGRIDTFLKLLFRSHLACVNNRNLPGSISFVKVPT